jgi:hypothetical protein
VERVTQLSSVPYYVDQRFVNVYGRDPRRLSEVEADVERSFVRGLEARCVEDKAKKGKLLREAKGSEGNVRSVLLQKAHEFDLSSCERLTAMMNGGG